IRIDKQAVSEVPDVTCGDAEGAAGQERTRAVEEPGRAAVQPQDDERRAVRALQPETLSPTTKRQGAGQSRAALESRSPRERSVCHGSLLAGLTVPAGRVWEGVLQKSKILMLLER